MANVSPPAPSALPPAAAFAAPGGIQPPAPSALRSTTRVSRLVRRPGALTCALVLGALATSCTSDPRPLSPEEVEALKQELRQELLAELRAEAPPASPVVRTERPPPIVSERERIAIAEAEARAAGDAVRPDDRPRLSPDPIPGLDDPTPREVTATALPDPPPPRHVEPIPEAPARPAPTAAAPDDTTAQASPVRADGREVRRGAVVLPGTEALELSDLAIGTSIADRLPQDVRVRYDGVPELLFCYNQWDNSGPEVTVTHVWRRGTRLVSRVELQVGKSPKWRTWSRQRTRADWTGPWSCEVLGPDGQRVGLVEFELSG